MIIHQFYDKGLAHASYAVVRNGKMVVIDPARNPQPYYDFAILHNADIAAVIETHPHADFVSSHLEIHQATDATIYTSKLVGAAYPHQTFDDGDVLQLEDVKLTAINTPGHSPDSICVLLRDEHGNEKAIFTGDTLFVGDVGRPDLRESVGNITAKKEELARAMYQSTREKLMTLPQHITVYPAHGPGSLCGKTTSTDLFSTIGREVQENYALQDMSEDKFVKLLLADQPFVPHYFGYDVDMNKKGAPGYQQSIDGVQRSAAGEIDKTLPIIDIRPKADFLTGHITGAINLQDGEKFETWLGSIIKPNEQYYFIGADEEALAMAISKAAKIGYEQNIKAAIISTQTEAELAHLDVADFKASPQNYTIVDVRNWNEINGGVIFKDALTIPLPELRDRVGEIPTDKPIVVHCAAGYRSAAASSIVAAKITAVPVYDLSETINELK